MRVHVLQHVEFEGPGSILTWLNSRGATVTYTRFYMDHVLPEPDGADLVIVMGGPMSANDESLFPWLSREKEYIRQIIRLDIPTLGICLGAQLIASAMGARVFRNPQKEIGWFPIESAGSASGVFGFPEKSTVFHWHGETFDLPTGAVLLAQSVVCKNQAFQLGKNVIGLQFHLETTAESAAAMIDNCANELVADEYVQSENLLRKIPLSYYAEVNALMEKILIFLIEK